jgi:hypothetical protein
VLVFVAGCAPTSAPAAPPGPPGTPLAFLEGSLRRWPRDDSPGELAVTDPETGRVAIYDSALVVLVLLRADKRERAARVLLGLAALQDADGGLPFSFSLPAPDRAARYERAGAIAWVGYAAVEYLDADAAGPSRDRIVELAHRAARWLLRHQLRAPGDPRDGLILGGAGTMRYDDDGDRVREVLVPGEVPWASVEHNVDSFFFLRGLGRLTGVEDYGAAATRLARALVSRAWDEPHGQFVEGLSPDGRDDTPALDCASWGSLFLAAAGDGARGATALRTADVRYASRDRESGARGHRPYAAGPLFPSAALSRRFARVLHASSWDRVDLVWPEGSAGVALAAWRAGDAARAHAIVRDLERLRADDGSLPTATLEVPFVLDRQPSIAGTAWVELLRFELARPVAQPTLWAP